MNLPLLSPDELREDLYANETLWRSSTRGVVLCNGAENVDDVEYWLSYMPMRNRAEVIRLMLAYADVPYAFEVVGYVRYEPEVKPTMNFGKTPALVDIDGQGTDLTHETAVTRYLADQLNLGGSDSLTRARVDELFSQYWHTVRNNGLTHAGELYSAADAELTAERERCQALLTRLNATPVGHEAERSRIVRQLFAPIHIVEQSEHQPHSSHSGAIPHLEPTFCCVSDTTLVLEDTFMIAVSHEH